MDTSGQWVIPLDEAANCSEELIGGKAAKLARARSAGLVVPRGFCITADAYEKFLVESRLDKCVAVELARKPLENMRWEEIWDTALRIRSEFLRAEIPKAISLEIARAVSGMDSRTFAVRSSALGEDSAGVSFAGLHESVVGVMGGQEVLDAVRQVWASLWSDAALLYRRELSLDPTRSRMAVLVQEVVVEDRSGVAFGRDPRNIETDCAIVEAVPGQCALLVDGAVDPDRWILRRDSGKLVQWRPGIRDQGESDPLLETEDLKRVLDLLGFVEKLFGWPPDVEWTGRSSHLTLLQARPITTADTDEDDKRPWYLSLRPGEKSLEDLAKRVSEELIPELEDEGKLFTSEDISEYSDEILADAIESRLTSLHKWQKIYWDDFIPFAHGVRHLARYYNDTVRPEDPYEFMGLLKKQNMLASKRNRAFASLAQCLRKNHTLMEHLKSFIGQGNQTPKSDWLKALQPLRKDPGGNEFLEELEAVICEYLDITVGSQRLVERPELILPTLLELAESNESSEICAEDTETRGTDFSNTNELEMRLFEAVGLERREEAAETLRIGRLSWRLRDDDNLLVSRIESQLYRAAAEGVERLRMAGRLSSKEQLSEEAVPVIIAALRDGSLRAVEFPIQEKHASKVRGSSSVKPRQLVGQPAAPGLAAGVVRKIQAPESFSGFRSNEILVCDAIQPMMTHLVPLAAGIVERRGGMLIHGAIIARELEIPCVNGIVDLMDQLDDGDYVTVDGQLGIVTVGTPEFDIEMEAEADELLSVK